jgi:hypothetical protein
MQNIFLLRVKYLKTIRELNSASITYAFNNAKLFTKLGHFMNNQYIKRSNNNKHFVLFFFIPLINYIKIFVNLTQLSRNH